MRTWLSIVGVLLAVAVGGMLVGLLGAIVWVSATDNDPETFVAEASATAGSDSSTGTPASGDVAATETMAPAIPTPTPIALEPIAISGNGNRTEPIAALSPGIAVFTIRYEGNGAFKAVVELGDGEPTATLADRRGAWDGSRAFLIRDGQTPVLNVVAEGPWDMSIERPLPLSDNIAPLPYEQSGTGSTALYYVEVPLGMYTLTASHVADGQFAVTIMNETGRGRVRLIDASGNYDDAVEFEGRFFPSTFLIIDVRATGDWTIRIE